MAAWARAEEGKRLWSRSYKLWTCLKERRGRLGMMSKMEGVELELLEGLKNGVFGGTGWRDGR